jgi:hemerythrin superfamily protein
VDVTRMLEADHRSVEALFDRIEKADPADRTVLIDELATSLRGHMELEERVVYPAIAPVVGQEPVDEGETEHLLARTSLDDMVSLGPDEPGFDGALEALKAVIAHHVEEEEKEVFPQVRRDGKAALDEMATPFMQTRMELGLPMEADALAKASTKEELLAEARSAQVETNSSMTKQQLAEALAEKMAS